MINPLTGQVLNALDPCGQTGEGRFASGNVCAVGGGNVSRSLASARTEKKFLDILGSQKSKVGWSRDLMPDDPISQRLTPVKMRSIDVDGVKVNYVVGDETGSLGTVNDIISAGEYPKRLLRTNTRISVWHEPYPWDEYYSLKYGTSFKADASGGDGSVSIYPSGRSTYRFAREGSAHRGVAKELERMRLRKIFLHEMGHGFAKKEWGSVIPPDTHVVSDLLDRYEPLQKHHEHQTSSRSEKFANAVMDTIVYPEPMRMRNNKLFNEITRLLDLKYDLPHFKYKG